MENIKLRIWSELWPEMYTTDDFNEPKNTNLFNRYETQYLSQVETFDCSIMRFTGVKDIDGVDLYEGDIITLIDFGIELKTKTYIVYDVETCKFTSHMKMFDLFCLDHRQYKKVGDIYNNPSLICS